MNKKKKKDNYQLKYLDLYHNSSFNLFIKNSNLINAGYGVFTHDFIPKDSFIDYYTGDIYDYVTGGTYYFQINQKYGIDAFNLPRCYMAMLNDADFNLYLIGKRKRKRIPIINPYSNNCEFRVNEDELQVMIYSKEDREIDSELFISYGTDYWK